MEDHHRRRTLRKYYHGARLSKTSKTGKCSPGRPSDFLSCVWNASISFQYAPVCSSAFGKLILGSTACITQFSDKATSFNSVGEHTVLPRVLCCGRVRCHGDKLRSKDERRSAIAKLNIDPNSSSPTSDSPAPSLGPGPSPRRTGYNYCQHAPIIA